MKQIRYFLTAIVFIYSVAAAKQPAEFDNLSDLSNSLPHVTSFDSLLFDLGNRFDRLDYLDLYDDFVAEYLYPIQNMVRYSFNTGLLLNMCRAYTVYRNNQGSFLIYSLVGPEGYTIYLADITDIQTTQFPPSLALFRFYKGQTFIWSTYNKSSNRLTVHNQSHCYNCEYENGEKYLIEQTQSYFLEKGLPYTSRFDKSYTYSVPENYIPNGPSPNIKDQCSFYCPEPIRDDYFFGREDKLTTTDLLDEDEPIYKIEPLNNIHELKKELESLIHEVRDYNDRLDPIQVNARQITAELLSQYLFPIKNMTRYSFCTKLLQNYFHIEKIDSIGNQKYLFYTFSAPYGTTTYMASMSDIQQGRYPITLAIRRSGPMGIVIWPTYEVLTKTLTIHNISTCHNCECDNDERIIVEQMQSYSLKDGIKPLPFNEQCYIYNSTIGYVEEPVDLNLHSREYKIGKLQDFLKKNTSTNSIIDLDFSIFP